MIPYLAQKRQRAQSQVWSQPHQMKRLVTWKIYSYLLHLWSQQQTTTQFPPEYRAKCTDGQRSQCSLIIRKTYIEMAVRYHITLPWKWSPSQRPERTSVGRIWNKEASAIPGGIGNSLENSMKVSQGNKNRLTMCSTNSTPRHASKEHESKPLES